MLEKSTWERFFDAHAPIYEDNVFTKNTLRELDFLLDDDQPMSILCNISRSLKPQAKALFTVLNGASMLRRYQNTDVAEGRFDPLTMVESSEHPPREGLPAVPVRERAFVPTELLLLFRIAGMSVLNMWGGTAGNWGKRSLDLGEIEIMVVARKTAEPLAAGNAGKPLG
jgi:hypothetical protein